MKIIHTADIHMGSKIEAKLPKEKADIRKADVRQAFNKMVRYAMLNDIKIILISGDLFDSARPLKKDKDFFYSVVKNNPDIDFIYLRGNHDNNESYSQEELANLKRFCNKWSTYEYEDITISGIELSQKENTNDEEIYYGLKLPEGHKNIVMLHGLQDELPVVSEKNIDYMALGHIHKFSEVDLNIRGKGVYSGCLEGRGFDEIGEKGFVVLDTDNMSYEFIQNSVRIIEEYTIDISEAQNSYEAYKIIANNVEINPSNLYRINICGEINFDGAFLSEDIEEYMQDDCFFVYVKNKTSIKTDLDKLSKEQTLKGEFVRIVLANANYSTRQKERIISVGLKAFEGQEAIK